MLADQSGNSDFVTLFLSGDVMTGRGIDQILPHPGDDELHEDYVKSAREYVRLAERANGPIRKPVAFDHIWGEALTELGRRKPDARIVNLETAVTRSAAYEAKGINYKMNPANVRAITAAGIDCCVLANNHVLDWGRPGLIKSLSTLEGGGVHCSGAGRTGAAAAAPAVLDTRKGARILVFGLASSCSGVPRDWVAAAGKPGVNLLPGLGLEHAERIAETMRALRQPRDVVVASIHWGRNWGYEVPEAQLLFAHHLIDAGAVDLVHGHSSHHFKAIERSITTNPSSMAAAISSTTMKVSAAMESFVTISSSCISPPLASQTARSLLLRWCRCRFAICGSIRSQPPIEAGCWTG